MKQKSQMSWHENKARSGERERERIFLLDTFLGLQNEWRDDTYITFLPHLFLSNNLFLCRYHWE